MVYQMISGEQITESDFNAIVHGVNGYGVWGGLAFSTGGGLFAIYTAGSYVDTAGAYRQVAAGSFTLSAAPGTGSDRYDLLYATGGTITKADGAAAPSASASPNPITPSGGIRLATYKVTAGVTQLIPTGFKDARIQLPARSHIVGYDATAATTTSATYATLKTFSLTAAQCQYPYLMVRASGRFLASAVGTPGSARGFARVAIGGTLKGYEQQGYVENGASGVVASEAPWNLLVRLVGGTDYTIGAATTVTIDGKATVTSTTGTVRYEAAEVVGFDA